MKTASKTPIRSSDELWLWAAEAAQSEKKSPSSRYSRISRTMASARPSSPMARGILSRLYSLLRASRLTVR